MEASGRIDVQSQYADPAKGRGILRVTDTGVVWELGGLFRSRTDGAKWHEIHTFGRLRNELTIAWLGPAPYGGRPLMAALNFTGSADDAEAILRIARTKLASENWRQGYRDDDGDVWEWMWTQTWPD